MAEFRMPSLGADMDSGVLLEWLVRPGDRIGKGDIVAVVDTAKAAVEVECFDSGVIERILVEPGTRVPVGTVLATIATQPAVVTGPPAPAPRAAPPPAPAPVAAPAISPLVRHLAAQRHIDLGSVPGTGRGGRVTRIDLETATRAVRPAASPRPEGSRVRASPLARRLATELGVDLGAVTGHGPGGAVQADDVRRAGAEPAAAESAAAEPAAAAPATGSFEGRAAAMRAQIATLMARSKREIPHYYLTETVDLAAPMDWLHARNRELPVPERLVPAALLLKAAALAIRTVPDLNGFFLNGEFTRADAVHLGVAISLRGGGLVAPAIHDADRLSPAELMARLKDLVVRTRAGRLRRAELSDPTITVSNLGEQGVESILGVIYPPQVALVGFGTVTDRPWAVHGLLGVRPLVTVSLAADHRVTDGAGGARYLLTIRQLLQRPEEL